MATKIVTVQEAAGRLLELIGLAEQGEEVVIVHNDRPKVTLVPVVQPSPKRVFGQRMRSKFDDPLPSLAEQEQVRAALGDLVVPYATRPGEDVDEEALARAIEEGFQGQPPLSDTILEERRAGP